MINDKRKWRTNKYKPGEDGKEVAIHASSLGRTQKKTKKNRNGGSEKQDKNKEMRWGFLLEAEIQITNFPFFSPFPTETTKICH